MDIISHGLWGGVIAKTTNRHAPKLKYWLAFGWGVFPDLFAFAIPFAWLTWNSILGGFSFSDFQPSYTYEPPSWPQESYWVLQLGSELYKLSHSLIVFALVFLLVRLVKKRPVWEMAAWLLHIGMDIPSHGVEFFATPFLWPVSDYHFNGIPWSHPWFLAANFGSLVITYFLLKKKSA